MIVDTSALVAILHREPEARPYLQLLRSAPAVRMSAASYVELGIVVDRRGDAVLSGALESLLNSLRIEIVAFTTEQARTAREAYRRFGRGSGHPARLNMGDCFAYACARVLGEPLLFKGRDFALTDIEIILEPDRQSRSSEIVATYLASAPSSAP